MDWENVPGSVANIDDFQGDDALRSDTSPLMAYLWGILIVLAVILALREWGRRKFRDGGHRDRERLWNYVVMALLWPLFVSAILFVVLWALLTRRSE